MHLLLAQKGAINEGDEAVDLGQTPGEIVVLSAADTELASLAQAASELGLSAGRLRLAGQGGWRIRKDGGRGRFRRCRATCISRRLGVRRLARWLGRIVLRSLLWTERLCSGSR